MLTALEPLVTRSNQSVRNDKGRVVFKGEPHLFADWEHQVRLKFRKNRAAYEPKADLQVMYEVAEDLRGAPADAFQQLDLSHLEDSVRELGLSPEEKIIQVVREKLFPNQAQNIMDLYMLGHVKGGMLSRASSEPVSQYIQ